MRPHQQHFPSPSCPMFPLRKQLVWNARVLPPKTRLTTTFRFFAPMKSERKQREPFSMFAHRWLSGFACISACSTSEITSRAALAQQSQHLDNPACVTSRTTVWPWIHWHGRTWKFSEEFSSASCYQMEVLPQKGTPTQVDGIATKRNKKCVLAALPCARSWSLTMLTC